MTEISADDRRSPDPRRPMQQEFNAEAELNSSSAGNAALEDDAFTAALEVQQHLTPEIVDLLVELLRTSGQLRRKSEDREQTIKDLRGEVAALEDKCAALEHDLGCKDKDLDAIKRRNQKLAGVTEVLEDKIVDLDQEIEGLRQRDAQLAKAHDEEAAANSAEAARYINGGKRRPRETLAEQAADKMPKSEDEAQRQKGKRAVDKRESARKTKRARTAGH